MLGVILSYSILRKVGLTMSKTTFCICMILMLVSSFHSRSPKIQIHCMFFVLCLF